MAEKKPTTADALLALAQAVNANTELLKTVVIPPRDTGPAVATQTAPRELPPAPTEIAPAAPTASYEEQLLPVPIDYRQVVDTVLNKSFGIEINPVSDSPAFKFVIVVPDKYTSISDEYRKMYKRDLRPKVIPYSEGQNGVRMWADKVFSSFNQDMRSMIVSDRVQGK